LRVQGTSKQIEKDSQRKTKTTEWGSLFRQKSAWKGAQ